MSFARVDAESSVVRWFLSRHGEAVLNDAPALMARLAQGRADVALVFCDDRVAGLVAWTRDAVPASATTFGLPVGPSTAEGAAEVLAVYSTDSSHPLPPAFVYGPDGPFKAAGIDQVWTLAGGSAEVKRWRAAGFTPDPAGAAQRDSVVRLTRSVEAG
jgi:hypothetical protein